MEWLGIWFQTHFGSLLLGVLLVSAGWVVSTIAIDKLLRTLVGGLMLLAGLCILWQQCSDAVRTYQNTRPDDRSVLQKLTR